MSAQYEERSTYVIDVPQPEGFEVIRPDACILRFAHGLTIDVGALCYTERSPEGRVTRRLRQGRKVVHDSRSRTRLGQVRRLIANVSEALRETGTRPETIRDRYSRFIAFMGWADRTGWGKALDDKESARAAFRAYVAHLSDRVGRNEITVNSGARQQFSTLVALESLLEVEDLGRGLNLLRTDQAATVSTTPPDDIAKGRVLALCAALFDGLQPLALEGAAYPYSLALPEYLGLPDNRVWAFPTNSWFKTPAMEAERSQLRLPGWGYNYQDGRVATLDELRAIENYASGSDVVRRQVIRGVRAQIRVANEDRRHTFRCAAAAQMMNVFLIQFLSQTGMNWAQAVELGWNDNYQVESSNQGFRTIKWRAGGKTVSFELPIAFMPAFRRYLVARKFILGERTFALLFFSSGRHGLTEPQKIRTAGMYPTYLMLRRLDPSLPWITSRQWRAAKSDWLLRNSDISTTALVLQNSEQTVRGSYAAGSETTAMQEMGDFLDKVSATVVERGAELKDSVARAVGKCTQFGAPVARSAAAAVKPDCGGPEGCLFCDKFKVHADEVDTRKLASCRHCIRVVSPSAGSQERQDRLFTPVITRIDTLLGEIASRDAPMVERVVREVDEEGELDAFWARKLEMLMELGLAA